MSTIIHIEFYNVLEVLINKTKQKYAYPSGNTKKT